MGNDIANYIFITHIMKEYDSPPRDEIVEEASIRPRELEFAVPAKISTPLFARR